MNLIHAIGAAVAVLGLIGAFAGWLAFVSWASDRYMWPAGVEFFLCLGVPLALIAFVTTL